MRIMLIILGLMVATSLQAKDITTESNITHVTVYPGMAMVTRQATVNLPSGDHRVVFEGIVPQINEQTLTVKAEATTAIKVFGAAVKHEYLSQAANEDVHALQMQMQEIEDQLTAIEQQQQVISKHNEYLDSIKFKAADQLPKDLTTVMPEIAKLKELGDFLQESYGNNHDQSNQLRLKKRTLDKEKEKIARQLNELLAGSQRIKRSIVVDVQSPKDTQATIMVSYGVYEVNWMPVYDARVNFEQSTVGLSLFANISQQTGEDWSKVMITVSTAQPAIGGVMPELGVWYLSPMEARTPQPMIAKGAYHERAKTQERFASSMDMVDSAYMLQENTVAASMAYAQPTSKGVQVTFKVSKPIDVKSDGQGQRLPLTMVEMPVSFQYAVTPRLTTYAYLRSQVVNNSESLLLPGSVNIFLDNDYVGNGAIAKPIAPQESFDLYLGVDQGVDVKYQLVDKKTDKTLIGGIQSPNIVIHYTYQMTIQHYKPKSIELNLFEHIPVPSDDRIKIKNVKFSVEPTVKDVEQKKGVMQWVMTLNPKEKKEVVVSFSVEYPRNLEIIGL